MKGHHRTKQKTASKMTNLKPRKVDDLEEDEAILVDELKYLAEQHLLSFTQQAWPNVEPEPYMFNWHLTLITEYLMAVSIGKLKRLAINIPPRYAKSLLVSIMWPCWEWAAINPSQKWVFASYAAYLSSYMSLKRRELISSDWYKSNWGDQVALKPDYNRQADYLNTRGGMMFSTSTGGTVTGMGGNRLVIDDPTNPQEAISEATRERVNDWFFNTFLSRLDDKINGSIVLIQQRLHQNDLTAFLTGLDSSELDGYLHEKNGWTLVRVPLIAEMDEKYISPLDGRVIKEVHEGELLWEEREGMEQVNEKRRDARVGHVFEAQQQQRPSSKKGAVFNRDWFQFYDRLPIRPDTWVMSVDTTFKNSAGSDYVCIGMWGWKAPDMYLDHLVRERLSFTQCLEVIRGLLTLYPATSAKLIEETANGAAILDMFQNSIGGFIPIRPTESKLARAHAVTPYFMSKNVHVKNAAWTHDYILEMLNFDGSASTKNRKDDQTDMTTQGINYMVHTFGGVQNYDNNQQLILRLVSRGRR